MRFTGKVAADAGSGTGRTTAVRLLAERPAG